MLEGYKMARYEDRDDSSVVLGVAAGLIVGVAIGGVLGLLFAPKSGEELRSDIKEKADEAIERLNDASSELATRAKELADRTRDSLTNSVEVGRDAYQKTKEELAARLDA